MRKRRSNFLMLVFTTFIFALSNMNVSAQWAPLGPDGGYVKCITRSGTTMYAVTGGGGQAVFASEDNGTTWSFITSYSMPSDIRSIAVIGNMLFLGTGTGVYRSDDNGSTWVEKTNGFPLGDHWVNKLAVSGSTLFAAATSSKILRSTDYGESWEIKATGITCNSINALYANDTVVFTGGGSNKKGVFRSVDNGNTWQQAITGMAYWFNGGWVQGSYPNINSFGYNGTDLYAGTLNGQGLWKSSNNGTSWVFTNATTRTNATYNAVTGDGTTVFAGTFNDGIIGSTDGGSTWSVATSGIDIYYNTMSFLVYGNIVFAGTKAGIYKTTDSGLNWVKASNGMRGHQIPVRGNMAFFSSDMFVGTDFGGIFRSSDAGGTWTAVNNGLPVNQYYGTYSVYGCSTALFGYGLMSTDNGNSWGPTNSPGTAEWGGIVPWIEHGTQRFTLKSYTDQGVYRSLDNGVTWSLVNNGIDPSANVFVSIYSDGTTLYLGTDIAYYYSSDNGDTWVPGVFPDYTSWSFTSASFVSAGTAKIMGLYGGGGQRGIFRSTDNGANWIQVGDLLVHKIVVSGSNIWASGTNLESVGGTLTEIPSIFLSQDNGLTWVKVSQGLSPSSLSLAAEGQNVYTAVSAPAYDVLRSSNNGANWVSISAGLNPNTQVTTLNVMNGKIIAGTSGHSLWQRNLSDFSPPVQPVVIMGPGYPCIGSSQIYSVANVPGVTYTWQFPAGWVVTAGSTTNSVTVTVGNMPGIVLVTPINPFGTGPAQFLLVSPTTNAPSQPGPISGTTNPLEGSNTVYSVANEPGVSYAWSFPAGWVQTGGGASNSVNVSIGSGSGDITVTPSTPCGTGTARTLAVVTGPANLAVGSIIIPDGQVNCYNATGVITVAGGGNSFLIQNGGQAIFIAGQGISFLPGTTVESGGYLLGTITTIGQYCGALPPGMMVAAGTSELPAGLETSSFRIYPNPAEAVFTLESTGKTTGTAKVEIFSMNGLKVFAREFPAGTTQTISAAFLRPGMYIVHVATGECMETMKLIKL